MLQRMAGVLETIKADDLPLNQMMDEFLIAMEAYQKFEIHVANETLDVKEVKLGDAGTFDETEFEWRNK